MKNIIEIDGFKAIISFDPDIELFRGEFFGMNGQADFYAKDIDNLKVEGRNSLMVFLEMCAEHGVEPRKEFSGKFNLRVDPLLHEKLAAAAHAAGVSLNKWITDRLEESA